MTDLHEDLDARIDRDLFPEEETLRDACADETDYIGRLADRFKGVQDALDGYKKIPAGLREKIARVVGDVKDDVRDLFGDESGFRKAVTRATDLLTGLIRGSAEELVRVKEEGDDLVFLVRRLMHYRNALLEFVRLEDPIDQQLDLVGKAVLIYEDAEGGAHVCKANVRTPVGDLIGDPASPRVRAVTLPGRRDLLNIIHAMYQGAEGVLERSNVFMVAAPAGAGLQPRQVLGKAVSLYRSRYDDESEGQSPPPEDTDGEIPAEPDPVA